MADDKTELVLRANSEKEVKKRNSDDKEGGQYYHTKLKAKNSDRIEWVKVKTTGEPFCEPDDEFRVEGIEGQTSLDELVEDNDVEEEMEG